MQGTHAMKAKRILMAALGWVSATVGFAADPVTDAINSAYVPYRAALFRTNSQAQAEAEGAISQASLAWQALISKYAKAPPPPYDRDRRFGQTLAEVAAIYQTASTEIRGQKLTAAHEILEKARDLMSDLRRRNNVVVYSDHMNAYHAAMEQLLDEGPKVMGQPQAFLLLMERVGALAFLAERLRSEASVDAASDPSFVAALKQVEQSLARLREAILSQDAASVLAAMGKIKGPYSLLFLKFG